MNILNRLSAAYAAFKNPPQPIQEDPLPIADWVPEYIEKIEKYIRDMVRQDGPYLYRKNFPEGRKTFSNRIDKLSSFLVDIADQKNGHTDSAVDPNIRFAYQGICILYAWWVFIMASKAKAVHRYGPEECASMQSWIVLVTKELAGIRAAAEKYAETYDVDNPKWIEAVSSYRNKLVKELELLGSEKKWAKVNEPCPVCGGVNGSHKLECTHPSCSKT